MTNFHAMKKTAVVANRCDGSRQFITADGELTTDPEKADLTTWEEAESDIRSLHRCQHVGTLFFEPVLLLTPANRLIRLADELESEAGKYSFGIARQATFDRETITCKIGKRSTRVEIGLNDDGGRPSFRAWRGRKGSDRYERASDLKQALDDLD